MTRMLALMLVMSLLSTSCNKSGDSSDNQETPTTATEAVESTPSENPAEAPVEAGTETTPPPVVVTQPTSTVPALAISFKTNVELIGFSSSGEVKYNEAVKIVKLVVATEEFRKKVLGHLWDGKKQFADNGGKTNTQIYQSILDAAEKLQPKKNNTLDIEAELYYADNSVVGYTYPSVTQIWVNSKFFNQYEPNQVAGNLFHEWLHKLGYGHDSSATAKRPYSVPYAIGYMIRDIGKKFL